MNNTARTNKEVRTNRGENVMRNTKATKNNKTMIAAISALVTATTMAAGLAVMAAFAPANKIENKAPAQAVTTTEATKTVNAQSVQAAQNEHKTTVKSETKTPKAATKKDTAEKAPAITQQAAPAVTQQAAPVVTQQAAPAVTQQAAPAVTQQAAPVAVQQQAETDKVNELGKHPGECGYGYVNENGKHPGECGYGYVAPEQTTAPAQQTKLCTVPEGQNNDWTVHNAKDGFPVGCYFGKTNAKSTLNVVMVNSYTYTITVTVSTGDFTANVYNITAYANGSKMEYSGASKSAVVYDANGNVIETNFIDNGHKGTFDASDAGYTWIDTDGTTVFVPWIGY